MNKLDEQLELLQAARHMTSAIGDSDVRHIIDNLLTGLWGKLSGFQTRPENVGEKGLEQYKTYVEDYRKEL